VPDERNFTRCREAHGAALTKVKFAKACEAGYTDQSVLNFAFPRRTLLPWHFNQVARHGIGPPNDTNASVLHFVGHPKPWEDVPRRLLAHPRFHPLSTREWRERCARFLHRRTPPNRDHTEG
jgi:lipopolysaccharide biosynthesis glycosyltransferase